MTSFSSKGCCYWNCFVIYWSIPAVYICVCSCLNVFSSVFSSFSISSFYAAVVLFSFWASFNCKQSVISCARRESTVCLGCVRLCVFLLLFLWIHTGRVRTKQPLSTASSVSSQVDSRGRSRTKMVSQSQRMYPLTEHYLNPAVSEAFWVSGPLSTSHTH